MSDRCESEISGAEIAIKISPSGDNEALSESYQIVVFRISGYTGQLNWSVSESIATASCLPESHGPFSQDMTVYSPVPQPQKIKLSARIYVEFYTHIHMHKCIYIYNFS